MALTYRILYRSSYHLSNFTNPVKSSVVRNYPLRLLANCSYQNTVPLKPVVEIQDLKLISVSHRYYTNNVSTQTPDEPKKKPGIIQRFRTMYRDYWYVLVPVHMVTSAFWLGSFYYIVRSGVDVLGLLESLGISESLIAPLRDSSAGYFALTFALYKIATPLRYAVTVGGTTFTIKKLTAIGWIKPVPSRERIKEMFQEKKEMLQEKKDNLQDRFYESSHHYQSRMKEKRNHVMDEVRRYKAEIRNMKNKVKKM